MEAPEPGLHLIRIDDQAGCTVGEVRLDGALLGVGPMTVAINVKKGGPDRNRTWFIDVQCVE